MTTFEQSYKQELALIQANGGNRDAVQFRFDCLEGGRNDFLRYIECVTIEFAGREKALKEYVQKLQEESP